MQSTNGTSIEALRGAPPASPAFETAQAWRGPDMARHQQRWQWPLQAAHVQELEAAVAQALTRLGDSDDLLPLGRADFPLPTLAPLLARIRQEALHGIGFALLRGVPVDGHDTRWCAVAFWGLGLYLGEPVSQNAKGHALGHVKDLGLDYSQPEVRGYQTRARLPYHTDYSDLVCLLCVKPAVSGGLSSIVSSVTLYNEMRDKRPDLAAALEQPLCRSRWGEVSNGQKPWLEVPVFNVSENGVSTTYARSAVRKVADLPGAPQPTPAQVEAMDYLDALAMDPQLHLDMEFKPGDVQVVNNHSIMHSRTDYEDAADWEQKRHLLRLWLACEDGPVFPEGMTANFQGTTAGGRPNGIHIEGVPLSTPLDAC
ncbi:MAG: TauD/TfdA family dioxygenase [Gammaproteobacteria bacterium]|nr:TauD/TfdA family dioxygenase [Gammaproteobacteria bacterium]